MLCNLQLLKSAPVEFVRAKLFKGKKASVCRNQPKFNY